MVWVVFKIEGEFKDVTCPACGSGAMFYQIFPPFYLCECQDCGAKFYVVLDEKGMKFLVKHMVNPVKSKYYGSTLVHNEFCPEHGVIKHPLFKEIHGEGLLTPICPKCKKPLTSLSEEAKEQSDTEC
ncbi:MAG: hypothetical protein QW090_04075 [Candidatus Bathyarchaeia archaeon]